MQLTDEQKRLFGKLSKDRRDSAKTLAKRSMSGVKRSVTEKYSDSAHFIYEILQNADDTKATEAEFILKEDELIFIHNGKTRFTISDVDSEELDCEPGTLGHINAITSIGQSDKDQSQIGKFGVGFKAVFQYTDTPYIYDNFCFRIDDFIVPVLLDEDYQGRKSNQTVFRFPFNKADKSPSLCRFKIKKALKSLDNPVLFLNHLTSIKWSTDQESGSYKKNIINAYTCGDITINELFVEDNYDDNTEEFTEGLKLYLCSREIEEQPHLSYSIAYKVDSNNEVIYDSEIPAYCFFKTKEQTHLKFFIQAPFLLTDSREGIIEDEEWNQKLIKLLAELVADSLSICRHFKLINDNFFKVLPIQKENYYNDNNSSINQFSPIYDAVLNTLQIEEILPVNNGEYFISKENAYLADDIQKVLDLFDQKFLANFTNNQNAQWVFSSVTDKQPQLWQYVKINLVTNTFDPEKIAQRIEKSLIENQTDEWLQDFYAYLLKRSFLWKILKSKPIIRLEDNTVVTPFEWNGDPYVYLPRKGIQSSFKVIKECFVEDTDSDYYKFLTALGLKQPDQKDEINLILKKYENKKIQNENLFIDKEDWQDFVNDFDSIFIYYSEFLLEKDKRDFMKRLKEIPFYLIAKDDGEQKYYFANNNRDTDTYLPNEELQLYFLDSAFEFRETYWLEFEFYQYVCNKFSEKIDKLEDFLLQLGVINIPISYKSTDFNPDNEELYKLGISKIDIDHLDEIKLSPSKNKTIIDYHIEGLSQFLNVFKHKDIQDNCFQDYQQKSILFWNLLIKIFEQNRSGRFYSNIKELSQGYLKYYKFRRSNADYIYFTAHWLRELQETEWLYDKQGIFHKPSEISVDNLADEYNDEYNIENAKDLIQYLKIRESIIEDEINDEDDEDDFSELEETKSFEDKIRDDLRQSGIELSDEEFNSKIEEFKISFIQSLVKQPNNTEATNTNTESQKRPSSGHHRTSHSSQDESDDDSDLLGDNDLDDPVENLVKKETREIISSVTKTLKDKGSSAAKRKVKDKIDVLEEDDELIPASENIELKIDNLRKKAEETITEFLRKQELENIVNSSKIYSFAWFKALLELEYESAGESRAKKNPIRVIFTQVNWDQDSQILVLSGTNYIPYSIEDSGELSLNINFKHNETKTIQVEAVSLQKQQLKAKLKNPSILQNDDLSEVRNAIIEVKNADFVLENLKTAFSELELSDDYNLQDNLPNNIKFIFGPPGTGKTTKLSQDIIVDYLLEKNARVLVLTPTNKACDVLAQTLIRESQELSDDSYNNWLVRYGETKSSDLENVLYNHGKTLPAHLQNNLVLITTIARFPYEYFTIENYNNNKPTKIKDFDWDYIIFDEASMISLASIVYVLYYKPNCQFVIGGDPFQINPVIHVKHKGWKDANIYTIVGLDQVDSFGKDKTPIGDFPVVNLTTQYRSIPKLGELFSQFTYKGILKHHRQEDDIKDIYIKNINLKPITIIDFKISQFESLYKPRKLQQSPYHIYSAILTVELVKYIIDNLYLYSEETDFYRIGIICPYRIQNNIVEKLLNQADIPKHIEVLTGTIHGFQGDECDLIIALFNPPQNISTNSEIFLNKNNILNVAISRARDYLILLCPVDKTGRLQTEQLKLEKIKQLCQDSKHYTSDKIEEILFGESQKIEQFCFSTSHQTVNVYANLEKRYEIRYDESAIDIQIRE